MPHKVKNICSVFLSEEVGRRSKSARCQTCDKIVQ